MSNLVDGLVEEAVKEHLLHLPLDPLVRSEVRDVRLLGRAGAGDEHPDKAVPPVDHYGSRVAGNRKGAILVAVRVDGDFDQHLDVALRVPADKQLHARETTESDACGLPVLETKQPLFTVSIKPLRLADLAVLYDTFDLEEPVEGGI